MNEDQVKPFFLGLGVLIVVFGGIAGILSSIQAAQEKHWTPAEMAQAQKQADERAKVAQEQIERRFLQDVSPSQYSSFEFGTQGLLQENERVVFAKYGYECELPNGEEADAADYNVYECSKD